jgi:hypothetical protein
VNSVAKKRKNKEDDDEGADGEPPMLGVEKKYQAVLLKYMVLHEKGAFSQPSWSFASRLVSAQLESRR